MNRINCIIVDDEPLARRGLKEYVDDVDFLQLVGEFENPLKATALINEGGVDLMFLDIQMPKMSGLEFFRTLQAAPAVIFTTAFPQYALDGFDLNAVDYLVKPVSFERFFKAALRAKERHQQVSKAKTGELPSGNEEYFFIKADNKLVKIAFDEVLYAEALQNYVSIQTTTKKYITYLTFKSIEDYLPANRFIRTHKSYIVAAAMIDTIEGNEIRIRQHSIPISRNNREEVMERLLKGKFLKR